MSVEHESNYLANDTFLASRNNLKKGCAGVVVVESTKMFVFGSDWARRSIGFRAGLLQGSSFRDIDTLETFLPTYGAYLDTPGPYQ